MKVNVAVELELPASVLFELLERYGPGEDRRPAGTMQQLIEEVTSGVSRPTGTAESHLRPGAAAALSGEDLVGESVELIPLDLLLAEYPNDKLLATIAAGMDPVLVEAALRVYSNVETAGLTQDTVAKLVNQVYNHLTRAEKSAAEA
jgi:hypothetical protein